MRTEKIKLKGFPTEFSDTIELPDIAELMRHQFFFKATAEDFRKYGNEFQRKLLDLAPIKNDKKNVFVTTNVKLLSPNLSPIWTKNDFIAEWHVDGTSLEGSKERFHLLLSDCTCLTEFNTNENIEIEYDPDADMADISRFLHLNAEELKITPKKIEPNKFVTFDSHVHRATVAERVEFRFFFQIKECDDDPYFTTEETFRHYSNSFLLGTRNAISCIDKTRGNDQILIDFSKV